MDDNLGQPAQAAMRRVRASDAAFLLLALGVVAFDQFSKGVIKAWLEPGERWPENGPFRFVHVTNSGAAFGLFQGAGALLVVVSLVGAAALFIYLFSPSFARPVVRAGLALMLGGAVGNLLDRVRDGEVVDFLKVSHWPAFNLADSAITVGVCLLIWAIVFEGPSSSADS